MARLLTIWTCYACFKPKWRTLPLLNWSSFDWLSLSCPHILKYPCLCLELYSSYLLICVCTRRHACYLLTHPLTTWNRDRSDTFRATSLSKSQVPISAWVCCRCRHCFRSLSMWLFAWLSCNTANVCLMSYARWLLPSPTELAAIIFFAANAEVLSANQAYLSLAILEPPFFSPSLSSNHISWKNL